MQGVTIYRIIPLFAIASLEHKSYPGVKSRYLTGDTALVICDILQLSGLLSSEEMRQRALGIPDIPSSTTSVNRVSNTQNNPHNERPDPTSTPTHNAIIQCHIPSHKGGTLEMNCHHDVRI